MHVITITSDWNDHDYYVASLKGRLLSLCPGVRIVDISHRVKPFNTAQAAFLVRNSYHTFPANTVHIIAVNSEPEKERHLLAARMSGHYLLCADNGLLGLLGGKGPELVVQLPEPDKDEAPSFISLSVFANAACRLAGGTPLEELGIVADSYDRQVPLRPTMEGNTLTGNVIHIDSYQNAITNISREFFEKAGKGRPFQILVQSRRYMVDRINRRYNETAAGDLLSIFNSAGLLEIAIRNGNAAGLLNLRTGSTIRIEFKEEEEDA